MISASSNVELHLDDIDSIKLREVVIESSEEVNQLAANDTLAIELKPVIEAKNKKRVRAEPVAMEEDEDDEEEEEVPAKRKKGSKKKKAASKPKRRGRKA